MFGSSSFQLGFRQLWSTSCQLWLTRLVNISQLVSTLVNLDNCASTSGLLKIVGSRQFSKTRSRSEHLKIEQCGKRIQIFGFMFSSSLSLRKHLFTLTSIWQHCFIIIIHIRDACSTPDIFHPLLSEMLKCFWGPVFAGLNAQKL